MKNTNTKLLGAILAAALVVAGGGYVNNQVRAVELQAATPLNMKSIAGNLEFLDKAPDLQGQPVLLEFWATWCPPCRASIAHLNEVYAKYHSKGLQVVGVTDEDRATVEHFRQKVPMNYTVALDKNQALAGQFQISTIPNARLIDKSGKVLWSGHPMGLDDDTIARVLPKANN